MLFSGVHSISNNIQVVPREPCLGPVLCLAKFSDFNRMIGKSNASIYADDEIIYRSSMDITLLNRALDENLKNAIDD